MRLILDWKICRGSFEDTLRCVQLNLLWECWKEAPFPTPSGPVPQSCFPVPHPRMNWTPKVRQTCSGYPDSLRVTTVARTQPYRPKDVPRPVPRAAQTLRTATERSLLLGPSWTLQFCLQGGVLPSLPLACMPLPSEPEGHAGSAVLSPLLCIFKNQ